MPTSTLLSVNNSKGFAALLLLPLLVVFLVSIGWVVKQNLKIDKQEPLVLATQLPTPTPIRSEPTPKPEWKTYTNDKYGFSLKYPASGMVLTEEGLIAGECGNAIKEEGKLIKVDNFFNIKIIENFATIDSYLVSVGAKTQYDTQTFTAPGADESIEVIGLKKGSEYAVGFPPLVYISHIYRKGDKIFLIKDLEHPTNLGGCSEWRFLDPVKHAHLKDIKWGQIKQLKFDN